jgi:uncharacterized protein with HEPN domain
VPPERRSRRLRLEDILTAAERIRSYTTGLSDEAFRRDLKTIDAVIRNFEVMGEAARHVDDDFAAAHPEVAWAEVRGFRNILAHAYFGVDVAILWHTVREDVPRLIGAIAPLVAAEPADSE